MPVSKACVPLWRVLASPFHLRGPCRASELRRFCAHRVASIEKDSERVAERNDPVIWLVGCTEVICDISGLPIHRTELGLYRKFARKSPSTLPAVYAALRNGDSK